MPGVRAIGQRRGRAIGMDEQSAPGRGGTTGVDQAQQRVQLLAVQDVEVRATPFAGPDDADDADEDEDGDA